MEFSQIAALLVVAGFFGIIANILKQPLFVGYLFAGIFLATFGFIGTPETLDVLAKIGVTLLLFLLGIEMNLKELPAIGRIALFAGLGQIVVTTVLGFLVLSLLGITILPSLYIAIALSFSSTIVTVKLLSEKKDLASLYGKISLGILLVQDLVAILILMLLPGLGTVGAVNANYLLLGVKAVAILLIVPILAQRVLPFVFEKMVATSSELLFIASISWALGIAAFVAGPLGFSLEIGGLLAGITLSYLPEHLQIATRARSLRDFFLTIFFVTLGAKLFVGGDFLKAFVPSLILSFLVLFLKPLTILPILGFSGYKRRTGFLTGLTIAQISEFSFILMGVGLTLGHVSRYHASIVTLVGVITMTVSTYLILRSEKLFRIFSPSLSIFERKEGTENRSATRKDYKDHVVIIGCDRTGRELIPYFQKNNMDFVIIDFNPKIISTLANAGIPTIFGDVSDLEVMEASGMDRARLVVSTTSSLSDNVVLLEYISTLSVKPPVLFTAQFKDEALKLYEKGATYVTVPDVVAGDHLRHLLKLYWKAGKLAKVGRVHYKKLLST